MGLILRSRHVLEYWQRVVDDEPLEGILEVRSLPVEGSAYAYSYGTVGEFFAWFIGWNLILEYMMGATTVAVAWSGYFEKLLHLFNISLPLGHFRFRNSLLHLERLVDWVDHDRLRYGGEYSLCHHTAL